MNVQEVFAKAENGTLTYEQFMSLSQGAKFVDLTTGDYVSKQKYTDDLAARDTRITTLDETVKTRETDLQNLRTQLEAAGTDNAKLTDVTNQLAELQKQYDKDTKAYTKQLKDQAYKFAVAEFANQQKFSSKAAKKQFEAEMIAKNLQMVEGTIMGATDFLNVYKAENEDSFEADNPNPNPAPKPQFVAPTPEGGNTGDANPIKFNFTGVRPH